MGALANAPGPRLGPIVGWIGGRISDPVVRLRFLRRAAIIRARFQFRRHFHRLGGWRLSVSTLIWLSLLVPAHTPSRARSSLNVHIPLPSASPAPAVWPVEKTGGFELYSNGLRVENEFAIPGRARGSYPVYARGLISDQPVEWRTQPAGIVFHSTESLQAPFEASEAKRIQRIGRFLLVYVKEQQSYNFLIDRFGRVYRVVHEDSIANHSGRSLWADNGGTYVNLNSSFLSIAFEAQTDASLPLSSAQLHAGRVLTDMLRGRFGIPAHNCVTHAQVSVNPWNWRIGYHTDWASGFPFSALGLPNNYGQPLPAVGLFGFDYDDAFLQAVGKPWEGLLSGRELAVRQAQSEGKTLAEWREQMHERYRRIVSSARSRANEESQDESFKSN